MIHLLKRHHPVFLIESALERCLPAWCFRCRRFMVFKLAHASDPRFQNRNLDTALTFLDSNEPGTIDKLIRLTGASPGDVDSTVVGMVAQEQSEWLGGLFLRPGQFYERDLGLQLRLPADSMWLFSSKIQTTYRRQGYYSQLLRFVAEYAAEKQASIYFSVDVFNVPSMKAHSRFSDSIGIFNAIQMFGAGYLSGANQDQVANRLSASVSRSPLQLHLTG